MGDGIGWVLLMAPGRGAVCRLDIARLFLQHCGYIHASFPTLS